MPIRVTNPATADQVYASPFVGPVNHTAQIQVNLTLLTNAEIDSKGYLKPGVPLTLAGILVGVAPAYVFGVTIEAIKVANGNAAGDISGASTSFEVAVCTVGQVNRAIAEDNLARAYTANELAGFVAAGSTIKLLQ